MLPSYLFQGLLAIQKAKGEQSDVANGHTIYTGNGNHGRLEEVEDQLAGLRKEREQLYAQIQADSLVKRFQEQVVFMFVCKCVGVSV